MKSLKNCIELSCSVRIYVPSTININQTINNSEWVDKTLRFLSNEVGGATACNAYGAWIDTNNNQLIKENVVMIFAYATEKQLNDSIDRIYEYCLNMKNELTQQAIAIEINNKMYLI